MTWVTYKRKDRLKRLTANTARLYKIGRLYIPVRVLYKNKIDIGEGHYDILINEENKTQIAIRFHPDGAYIASNASVSGYEFGNLKIFKDLGVDFSKARYFQINFEEGMITIDFDKDEIHFD